MAEEQPEKKANGHNVFISFSSRDRRTAKLVCKELERRGLRCWISSRDVQPGENYQSSIVRALKAAKVVVLLFTSYANTSEEIKKEISLASRFKIAVIPVRVEDVSMDEAFSYELATRQWVDAYKGWESALENLAQSALAYIRIQGGDAPGSSSATGSAQRDSELEAAANARLQAIIVDRLRELEQLTATRYRPAGAPPPTLAPSVPTKSTAPPPAAPPPIRREPSIAQDLQDLAQAALAAHVGPIARVLVKRHASTASSAAELVESLAAEVSTPEGRVAFKQDCRKRGLTEA